MRRRKPHSFGLFHSTPRYVSPRIPGLGTLKIYYTIADLEWKVYCYFSSLYLISWAPYWFCAFIFWLWPMNADNCTCCLRKANDYALPGPRLWEVQKAARLGCARCSVVASAVAEVGRRWDEKVENGKFVDAVSGIHFRREEKAISLTWRKNKDQLISELSAFRLHSRQGMVSLLVSLRCLWSTSLELTFSRIAWRAARLARPWGCCTEL